MTVHLNLPKILNQCFNWPPKKRHRILWKKSDDPRLDHLDEYPRSGNPIDGWEIVEIWFDHIWSIWIEVKWNVYVIGHCLPANWHRWFNSLCRNWDWNSQSDGCAKVRWSGLRSGHMNLPFMSFSFYKGIFKRIFRFLAVLGPLAINEDGMAVCMGWFTSLTNGATLWATEDVVRYVVGQVLEGRIPGYPLISASTVHGPVEWLVSYGQFITRIC